MRTSIYKVLLIVLFLLVINCRTLSISLPPYSLSKNNILDAKKLFANKVETKIKLGSFLESSSEPISCGLNVVIEPLKERFGDYIKKALADELEIAEVYSDNGKIILSGRITYIDLLKLGRKWKITMDIYLNDKKKYSIDSEYDHQSQSKRCSDGVNAFLPAVQELNSKIINHPDLKKFIDEIK